MANRTVRRRTTVDGTKVRVAGKIDNYYVQWCWPGSRSYEGGFVSHRTLEEAVADMNRFADSLDANPIESNN